ncbi:hypothetical protein LUD75_18695 [Epilithonimonas sp. JDS]|uniref:hypothetical protein n=1 Tax=Epilithonimonas sp. JDS TaxID=2902797 RepID=UPI001E57E011|nr:hypothetical protein [Epilithonimonas sp. JDS]MCD9856759.1 hypothetical protein [Epilithonimonas sp. JDS]
MYFQIDRLKIEWGKTLNEVRPLLENIEQFKPYGGWPNIRCSCLKIFGLAAIEAEVRAPFEDRPVLQVQYELSPIKSRFWQKQHVPYMEQLEKVLGTPVKSENLYNHSYSGKENLSGSVVHSSKWLFNQARISLSVYGSVRNKDSGLAAAGIFIDLTDEIAISTPFREVAKSFEKKLSEFITEHTPIAKFKLGIKQKPFQIVDYDLRHPYIAEKTDDLRTSQRALYKRELYQTPSIISSKLEVDEIGYYKVPAMNQIFVSNKWDTVFLSPDQINDIKYWDILPARGAGRKELDLKELRIEDDRYSTALLDLMLQIESDTAQEIEKRQGYDD